MDKQIEAAKAQAKEGHYRRLGEDFIRNLHGAQNEAAERHRRVLEEELGPLWVDLDK